MRVFSILLLSLCTASATPLKLAWDVVPGCSYRVLCGIKVLADNATSPAVVEVPDVDFASVTVQAYNAAGTATSDPFNLALVRFQWSEDLINWRSTPKWIPTTRGFVRIAYPKTAFTTP